MEDELSLENILDESQISDLFPENDSQQEPEEQEPEEGNTETKETKEPETTEVDPDSLFGEEPESVGSDGDTQGQEGTTNTKGSTSPNFYSSIASALVEDGVFQNLEDKDLSKIDNPTAFADFVKEQVQSQLDDTQKRVSEALRYGVEPSAIQKYEAYLRTLNNINEDALTKDDEQGEKLRKNLIYQDYINRGYKPERAAKLVERSLSTGTDIEDAKEALQSNKEYFGNEYKALIDKAKAEELQGIEDDKKVADQLKASILDEDKAFGEVEVDKKTRQKVFDNICKPVWTNPQTGERFTALQKYEAENRVEFMKNLGLIFTLTDGFKNLNGLVGGKVKKELKKGLKELESTINNTQRTSDGALNFVGNKDPESRHSTFRVLI